jgi:hypothetical protein
MRFKQHKEPVITYEVIKLRRYDMNVRSQMQGGKNRILPKEINANRFFRNSHWLEIWKNRLCPIWTEWRESGYVLWQKEYFYEQRRRKVKLCFSLFRETCKRSARVQYSTKPILGEGNR